MATKNAPTTDDLLEALREAWRIADAIGDQAAAESIAALGWRIRQRAAAAAPPHFDEEAG